ncbi:cytochrome-c peroxidase [Paracoccus siganidrum]|uniref:Methylamine utilization protein MauG n=1 Tax=Paracoccus siganidrum TaxID=1276757 RepID=A0A418ZUH3_9RHOB|nr:cytochrome c peroxidase [Paracoccus siganidrum]RJL02324.1 methylamine utilization protein MauG [Paracoccus siganidrum]RMC39587.1 methylamine utilization protein MauG [Paracoccus siganidrum]
MRGGLNILLLLSPVLLAGSVIAGVAASGHGLPPADRLEALEELGRQLFHEPLLSRNGSQSCATCHDPDHAFTDPRETAAGRAVSLGDDGTSHGDRNTPTLSYAFLSPAFHRDDKGRYKGGQFWDGRADDLKDQAGQPMLNPVEMGMPDKAAVIGRLRGEPGYVAEFEAVFGPGALEDIDRAFDHAAEALAAYQSTPEFAPFDSKYDRYLRGEAELTPQEEFGHTVFITWNCRLCHQLRKQGLTQHETFTSFEYHNIGVPANHAVRALNGLGPDHVDRGLAERPGIDDPAQAGRVKVPTLRNVAVTGPYMRNGVFEDLRTAVLFYNKYPSRRPIHQINPETGADWGPPEVAQNLSLPELQSGLMVDDARIDALVAFLETLTDRRYEPLLEERRRERAAAGD